MAFKHKFSYEKKVKILSEHLDGTYGFREVYRHHNINRGSLKNWKSTIKYTSLGCTRQAKNPQHIADNILHREFHADAPNEK